MTRFKYLLFIILFIPSVLVAESTPRHFPSGEHDVYIPNVENVRSKLLQNIAPIVERSINKGFYPGAVVFAGHDGEIIYRGVFGNRRILPNVAPMRFDTIFDLASLTKVVVTTTAIMQLVEKGKLDLDAPVRYYWTAFGNNGKANVTVRELLTHTSGFPVEIPVPASGRLLAEPFQNRLSKYAQIEVFNRVEKATLIHPPGSVFKYSDVNFIALGHLVEIISGEDLNSYARKHIFEPLGMQHTFYLPPQELKNEIAPTQIINGKLCWGEVHDDIAYFMGGVSGMAGVFSNAEDLGRFAQCLLNGGRIPSLNNKHSKYLLGPLTVLKMATPQTPPQMTEMHGLGWDIDTVYSIRGSLFPINSYGHTGWTGTSMWIDPKTRTWLIILTSRSHPTLAPFNQLINDRKAIANIIAGSITDVPTKNVCNTGKGELARAYHSKIQL